jgi:hypothetical protein
MHLLRDDALSQDGVTDRGAEPVNIWTVDKATISAEIRQRNTLRKSALLPLLE